jgi:hypothetical protein
MWASGMVRAAFNPNSPHEVTMSDADQEKTRIFARSDLIKAEPKHINEMNDLDIFTFLLRRSGISYEQKWLPVTDSIVVAISSRDSKAPRFIFDGDRFTLRAIGQNERDWINRHVIREKDGKREDE